MEPSHKDAETAAAAAAAGDPRAASSSSGVVVQVREKKGPLRAAIPYMPFPVAVICLFLNTFVPGLATEVVVTCYSGHGVTDMDGERAGGHGVTDTEGERAGGHGVTDMDGERASGHGVTDTDGEQASCPAGWP
ncbi:protein stum homolog isoform X4 [Mirounga angustirostris]|uniref:protein stum homolog isoform X4 n=1 Tax=Mirounga angustirostris TaxID=9716 RepID=UPI00313B7FCF